jgi:predicted transcriptional regulator of viral defense system
MAVMAEGGRETQPGVSFFSQAPPDTAIAALATAQNAVFSLAQLIELGLSAAAVRKRTSAQRLHRVHPGVYSLVPAKLLRREGHWMAAVLACGPGAVLSHQTAAALHGLRGTNRAKIDVTVPGRSARKHPGIDIHRSRTLTPADTTIVNGIPCTTVARTLLDLAEVVSRRALERAFDQAEILQVFDLRALEDQLERNPTRAGARAVRRVLDEHYVGSTLTQSELEEAFLALCRRIDVPAPELSKWIDFGDGEPMIWADFAWCEQRVIVETDGRKVHGTHQARERDPRRDQRAMLAGWRPVRTTWRQVTRKPRELEAILGALLAERPNRLTA